MLCYTLSGCGTRCLSLRSHPTDRVPPLEDLLQGWLYLKVVAKGDFWKHMVFNIFHSISATTNRTQPKYVG